MMYYAVFFVLIFSTWQNASAGRAAVTNEDIRDAILQVVNVIRNLEDKLERHEYGTRAVGELLKKGMINVDKRIKSLDPIKGTVSRLDQRLAAVETILMQKDEKERKQLQKTYETVDDIQKNLPLVVDKLKSEIIDKLSKQKPAEPTIDPKSLVSKDDIQSLKNDVLKKVDNVSNIVNNMQKELEKIKDDNKNIRDINNKSTENMEKVKRQLDTSEQLLEKYESKLAEYNNRIPEVPANFEKESHWEKDFLQALESQKTQVKQVATDLLTLSTKLTNLPNKADIQSIQYLTKDIVKECKEDSAQLSKRNENILDTKLHHLLEILELNQNSSTRLVEEKCELANALAGNFSNTYSKIYTEIQALNNIEQVMVQTADSVLETKRRLEYSVHQIVDKVGGLIKTNSKDISDKMNERFDVFEMSILDEETGALANLTSKIGEEIDQVWRQIGIMHQQMSASTDTLNKLQNQTDAYVNGSLDVMDNMKGKVGKITSRMAEVDDNLNYLLGRLSLVTQEFNQVKKGLSGALDEIRGSFQAVQSKLKDEGPGPHNITSNDVTST